MFYGGYNPYICKHGESLREWIVMVVTEEDTHYKQNIEKIIYVTEINTEIYQA